MGKDSKVKADFSISVEMLQKVLHDWLAEQKTKDLGRLLKELAKVA